MIKPAPKRELLFRVSTLLARIRRLEKKRASPRHIRWLEKIAVICLKNHPLDLDFFTSGSFEHTLHLLQDGEPGKKLVLQRLAEILETLTQSSPFYAEKALRVVDWIEVFAHQTAPTVASFLASRRSWVLRRPPQADVVAEILRKALDAACLACEHWDLVPEERSHWIVSQVADFLDGPVFLVPDGNPWKNDEFGPWWSHLTPGDRAAIGSRLDHTSMTRPFAEWLEARDWEFARPYSNQGARQDVAEAARLCFDAEMAADLVRHLTVPDRFFRLQAWDDDLAARLCSYEAEKVAGCVMEHWRLETSWKNTDVGWRPKGARVKLGAPEVLLRGNQTLLLERLGLPLGYLVGVTFFDEKMPEPDLPGVEEELAQHQVKEPAAVACVVTPYAQLWFDLRKLAEYEKNSWQRKTDLTGLRPRIADFAMAHPDVWSQSLTWILARASDLGGLAEALTVQLALEQPAVRRALESAASPEGPVLVRDRARGILAVVQGAGSPSESVIGTLLDFVARFLDGRPAFPHPLSPTTSIWLGTPGLERLLSDGIQRACSRFRTDLQEFGLRPEPALVAELVKELIVAFRDTAHSFRAFDKGGSTKIPAAIEVSERQLWQREEKIAFCDIALLLRARVPGNLVVDSVELVQAKVSKRHPLDPVGKAVSDLWELDVLQLRGLIGFSQTAVYWLITGDGEIYVAPARLLLGIVTGTDRAGQKTATVHFHQIRIMAIPLWQFLVDLLIGVWLGSSSPATLAIANGENAANRPRHVIQIDLTLGHNEKQG